MDQNIWYDQKVQCVQCICIEHIEPFCICIEHIEPFGHTKHFGPYLLQLCPGEWWWTREEYVSSPHRSSQLTPLARLYAAWHPPILSWPCPPSSSYLLVFGDWCLSLLDAFLDSRKIYIGSLTSQLFYWYKQIKPHGLTANILSTNQGLMQVS